MNLLDNAIKFTAKGAVKLELEGDTYKGECLILKFKIIDTGIGISQAHQDSLFEAYKQLDVSISRRYNGTGLGLAISKWLTELMGGEIGYESVEGKGSTFWFTIVGKPAALGVEATESYSTAKSYISTRSLRILLAEDNILNQQVIKAILLKLNHTVDAASDGFSAVEAARSTRYDLVLMDIWMPKMDGLEASRLIRKSSKELSEIPIIAITADAMSENYKRYLVEGLNDCVTKPIKLLELVQAINRVLNENIHVAATGDY